jgi:HSP20 family protein
MTTLIRRNNNSLFNPLHTLFDDLFSRELFDGQYSNFSNTGTNIPAVNIKETKENFEVEVAAPGMTKDDFKIELKGNTLTIFSEKSNESEQEDNHFTRREFSYQSFNRSFNLPKDAVDTERIQARYENGLLKLSIPKKEEAKQKEPKQIEIQ